MALTVGHQMYLNTIDLDEIKSEGYSFQIELKYRAYLKKFSIREIPILFSERREGQSKMSGGIIFEALYKVLMFRFSSLITKIWAFFI